MHTFLFLKADCWVLVVRPSFTSGNNVHVTFLFSSLLSFHCSYFKETDEWTGVYFPVIVSTGGQTGVYLPVIER